MKTIKYITATLILFFMTGCQDVIPVDLNSTASRLVIDASINWYKGTTGNEQTIKLTKTTDYYSADIPAVSGAIIFITSNGINFNFIEIPNTGKYVCTNFVPVIGQNYDLTVMVENQTYIASEKFIDVPQIEPTVDQDNSAGVSGDEIKLKFHFQDNGHINNYYLTRFDCSIAPFPEFDVKDNETSAGNLLFKNYDHKDLKAGDVVKFSLFGISKPYSNFMDILLNAADSGKPFQSTPTNARGNIINQTNESNFALGYFRLTEADTKTYVVQ
jgi:Domain of unknown function (DUF4249)